MTLTPTAEPEPAPLVIPATTERVVIPATTARAEARADQVAQRLEGRADRAETAASLASAEDSLIRSKTAAGQRRVNIVWELTQAAIALSVIGVTLFVDGRVAMAGVGMTDVQASSLMQLNVMAGLVIGFYFGRTNHQRTGGIGGERAGDRGI